MTTKYHPEVRKQIRHMQETGFTAFFATMKAESFSEPDTAENVSIMLEAIAGAAAKMVGDHPDREALLKTFSLDILDQVKE